MESQQDRTKILKIVLMGEGAVGKTSLRRRYMGKGFESNYLMTIGADFAVKKVVIDGKEYMIQIWDLSGQPNFYEVRKLYYKNSSGMLLVYDKSKMSSLKALPGWIEEYRKNSRQLQVQGILIGNKIDLLQIEELTERTNQAQSFLEDELLDDEMDLDFITTSAKTGENVDEAFNILIRAIITTGM